MFVIWHSPTLWKQDLLKANLLRLQILMVRFQIPTVRMLVVKFGNAKIQIFWIECPLALLLLTNWIWRIICSSTETCKASLNIPPVKYAMWCNSCISFAQMPKAYPVRNLFFCVYFKPVNIAIIIILYIGIWANSNQVRNLDLCNPDFGFSYPGFDST